MSGDRHPPRLDGEPAGHAGRMYRWACRLRFGRLGEYVWRSRGIPGWTRGDEALALAQVSYGLPDNATIVELGSFLGCSAVLLAGARKLKGSGRVHCVDTFEVDGDVFSRHIYEAYRRAMPEPFRAVFERNVREAGLQDWVEVHGAPHIEVASAWSAPIDLLFMDADHSPEGARRAYAAWVPHLKPGGTIAIHNSCGSSAYADGHDGSMRLAREEIKAPGYSGIRCVGTTTFAQRSRS